MSSYKELKAQAEELLRKAEEMRKQEVRGVIAEIRALMAEYDITVQDLESFVRRKGVAGRKPREIKYRGPNGEVWTGGPGRKPAWVQRILADGGDIEQYRIQDDRQAVQSSQS